MVDVGDFDYLDGRSTAQRPSPVITTAECGKYPAFGECEYSNRFSAAYSESRDCNHGLVLLKLLIEVLQLRTDPPSTTPAVPVWNVRNRFGEVCPPQRWQGRWWICLEESHWTASRFG